MIFCKNLPILNSVNSNLPVKKKLILLITIVLFAASVALLVVPKSVYLGYDRPQDPINPSTLAESFQKSATFGIFNNEYVPIPQSIELAYRQTPPPSVQNVLSAYVADKRIEVDLTNQRLYAFDGGKKVYDFLISSGKYDSTPTGVFHIWTKIRSQKMSGGSREAGTYYYLPNVPYIMFFYNDQVAQSVGYSLHGTYWHNNFGHPMSHGCVNMKTEEAELVYYWAQPDLLGKTSIRASDENPGTPIIIYGDAPSG